MGSASGTTSNQCLVLTSPWPGYGLGLVKDCDSIVDFVDDGEFRVFEGFLELFIQVK